MALAPYIDIWLPDFKILLLSELSARYSAAPDYFPVRLRSSQTDDQAHRSAGIGRFSPKMARPASLMKRGVNPAAYWFFQNTKTIPSACSTGFTTTSRRAFSGKPYEPVHPLLPEQQYIRKSTVASQATNTRKSSMPAIELGLTQGFMQEKKQRKRRIPRRRLNCKGFDIYIRKDPS